MDSETLVFVEVKLRTGTWAGAPEEAVDDRKQARIRKAAEVFIARNRAENRSVRFDVIAITGAGSHPHIEHLKDAF